MEERWTHKEKENERSVDTSEISNKQAETHDNSEYTDDNPYDKENSPEDVIITALLARNAENEERPFITPKTPEKKHPVKHISNIETPFKLKIKRNTIKYKDSMKENTAIFRNAQIFQDLERETEESEWFRKKRGRKEKTKIITESAQAVIKGHPGVCPVTNYLSSHFLIKATIYTGTESEVHLVEEKSLPEIMQICTFCRNSKRPLEETLNESTPTIIKISRRKWTSNKERHTTIKEAKFLHRLRNSSYITRIIKAWEENSLLHIQMAFCNKGTLREIIRQKGKYPNIVKYSVILQILKALKTIHSHNIIHLDIKPDNIYLHHANDQFTVKIGDFGISRSATDQTEIECDGDRLYMAPELLQNTCSFASDIYSAGLILIELLFEVLPVKGVDWSKIHREEKKRIVHESGISTNMYSIIKEMIEERPEKRPTAREVVRRIKAEIH